MLVTNSIPKISKPSEDKADASSTGKKKPVFYPESDGKPMAETDVHRSLLLSLVGVFQYVFPDAYVSGNICLYYEEGNPKKMISPDVLLCRSQHREMKRVYFAWESNAQLDLVIELSSKSTKKTDHHKKKRLYAEILQVPYYVIFDPEAWTLDAFVLQGDEYQDLPIKNGRCHLDALNVSVGIDPDVYLRVFDHQGTPVLTTDERAENAEERAENAEERAENAEERAENARKQATQYQQENQDLREELEALRRQLLLK